MAGVASIIRPACEADRPAIEDVVHRAYEHYIARMGRRPGPMDDDYAAQIAAGKVEVLLADGQMVGLVVLMRDAETMLLHNLAVHPSAKGKGFGRLLLEHAHQRARDAGCTAIRLYTHETMRENIALYTRIGYRETHRASEDGFARVFMTKSLP